MPIKPCPWCRGRLRPTGKPKISEGYFEDVNGVRHPRYKKYECEGCGRKVEYDARENTWRDASYP